MRAVKAFTALEKAKAEAINVDTMVKWNKALRARQLALREEKRQEAIKRETAREQRVEELELRDGTTLNNLLLQIFDADPGVVKSSLGKDAHQSGRHPGNPIRVGLRSHLSSVSIR